MMTGLEFRAAREGLKLSQRALAAALDISLRTVQYLEAAAEVPVVYELAIGELSRRLAPDRKKSRIKA